MPIFEFQCGQCGHVFEELVLSGDKEEIRCPKCRKKRISRLVSRTGSVRKSGSPSVSKTGSAASCGAGKFT